MREIKFRVWDKLENKMVQHPSYWNIDLNGGVNYGNAQMTNTGGLFEYPVTLMQYTGLKDKNGKEIYEGDVVQEDIRRDKRSKPIMRWSVVVYSEKGMFIVECLPKSLRQWNELYKENDEVEVIGNIYESEHLIDNTDMKV